MYRRTAHRQAAAHLIIKLFSIAIKGKETTTGNYLLFLFQLILCFSKEHNITKCATKYLWKNLYIPSVPQTLYQLSTLTKKISAHVLIITSDRITASYLGTTIF
jgi:hypothetical protein